MRRVFATCLLIAAVFAATVAASEGFGACQANFINGTYPTEQKNSVRICREGVFGFSYDIDMIDPSWSAYYVTPAELKNTISGREDFYLDPDLKNLGITQAAVDSDAFGTEWNRGHLGPNHILSYSAAGKHASFTMANVAPQEAYFNQHPWNELEQKVYDWVSNNNALYIVTGIAYKDRKNPTRRSGIAVPDYYWKVLCDAANGQSVGFLGENWKDGDHSLLMRKVTEIEAVYGGRVFPWDACYTDKLDQSYWWSEKSTSTINDNRAGNDLVESKQ